MYCYSTKSILPDLLLLPRESWHLSFRAKGLCDFGPTPKRVDALILSLHSNDLYLDPQKHCAFA